MQSHDAEYRESGEGWARTPKPTAMTAPLSDTRPTERVCEQCGRAGTRGFTVRPAGPVDTAVGPVQLPEYTECTNRTACRKRWPKRQSDDD